MILPAKRLKSFLYASIKVTQENLGIFTWIDGGVKHRPWCRYYARNEDKKNGDKQLDKRELDKRAVNAKKYPRYPCCSMCRLKHPLAILPPLKEEENTIKRKKAALYNIRDSVLGNVFGNGKIARFLRQHVFKRRVDPQYAVRLLMIGVLGSGFMHSLFSVLTK